MSTMQGVPQDTIPPKYLLTCLGDLSDELEFFGLQPLPKWKSLEGRFGLDQNRMAFALKAVISAGFDLMQRLRIIVQERSDTEMKRQRLFDDYNSIATTVKHMKADLKEQDRLLSVASEEQRKLQLKFDKAQKDLKIEQEEVRQLKQQIRSTANQSSHTLRRKEQEIVKLHDQLSGYKRPKKPPTPKEEEEIKKTQEKEELYKRVICKFEMKNQNLMKENTILQRSLYSINTELAGLVEEFKLLLDLSFDSSESNEAGAPWRSSYADKVLYELTAEESGALSQEYIVRLLSILVLVKSKLINITSKGEPDTFHELQLKQEVET